MHSPNYQKYILLCIYLHLYFVVSQYQLTYDGKNFPSSSIANCSALNVLLSLNINSRQNCRYIDEFEDPGSLLRVKGDPLHIMYNRVPKTGSTTLRTVMREHTKHNQYKLFWVEVYVPFMVPKDTQREITRVLYSVSGPALYERHLYYFDFSEFGRPRPAYINLVRDPLKRTISSFYFTRSKCKNTNVCYMPRDVVNETLDQCVSNHPVEECIGVIHGVAPYVAFFCGQTPLCEKNKTYALEMAKKNIIDHYTVVGTIEEVHDFLFVLEYMFPKYFANIRLTFMSHGTARSLNVRGDGKGDVPPSEQTKAILEKALAAEYELYYFIKRRFHVQYRQILQLLANRK